MAQRGIILITGASTGIGFQIVRALAGSDKVYDIILGGRTPVKVQEAISSAEAEFPSSRSKLFPLQVDIEHDDSIKKAFEKVQSRFGRLDALVNNAGMRVPSYHSRALCKLTKLHNRRATRPTVRRRPNDRARDVEPVLEHQHRRHANPDLDLHSAAAPKRRPAPPLPHIRNVHSCRDGDLRPACEQVPTQRLAEERLRRSGVPQQQDGYEYDDAGMASHTP